MAKRCIEKVYDPYGWDLVPCKNRAKYGDYCGVHSPEKRAERKARRGPTQFEVALARGKRVDAVVGAARVAVERWKVGYDGVEEALADLRDAIDAYDGKKGG